MTNIFEGFHGSSNVPDRAGYEPINVQRLVLREEEIAHSAGIGRRGYDINVGSEASRTKFLESLFINSGAASSAQFGQLAGELMSPSALATKPNNIAGGWGRRRFSFEMLISVPVGSQMRREFWAIYGFTDGTDGVDTFSHTIRPDTRFYVDRVLKIAQTAYATAGHGGYGAPMGQAVGVDIKRLTNILNRDASIQPGAQNGQFLMRPQDTALAITVQSVFGNGTTRTREQDLVDQHRVSVIGERWQPGGSASSKRQMTAMTAMHTESLGLNDLAPAYLQRTCGAYLHSALSMAADFDENQQIGSMANPGFATDSSTCANGAYTTLSEAENVIAKDVWLSTLFAQTGMRSRGFVAWSELTSLCSNLVDQHGRTSNLVEVSLLDSHSNIANEVSNPNASDLKTVVAYAFFNGVSQLLRQFGIGAIAFNVTNMTFDGSWHLEVHSLDMQVGELRDREVQMEAQLRTVLLPSLCDTSIHEIAIRAKLTQGHDSLVEISLDGERGMYSYPAWAGNMFSSTITDQASRPLELGNDILDLAKDFTLHHHNLVQGSLSASLDRTRAERNANQWNHGGNTLGVNDF